MTCPASPTRGGALGAEPGTHTPSAASRDPSRVNTSAGEPSATTPPPAAITTTRSTRGSASVTRCSTSTSVRSRSAASLAMSPRTAVAPSGSRFAVGSSRSRRRGDSASAPASARRCFSPPESASVRRSSGYGNATAASAAWTAGQMALVGTHRFSSPNATSSPARAMTSCVSGSWKTMAVSSRAARGATPRIRSSPSRSPPPVSSRRPASASSSVLFPAPDAPRSRTRSPSSTRRSRPRTAQAWRPAWRQPQPRASMAGVTPAVLHALLRPPRLELREHAALHERGEQGPRAGATDDRARHDVHHQQDEPVGEREIRVEHRYVVQPAGRGGHCPGDDRGPHVPDAVPREREHELRAEALHRARHERVEAPLAAEERLDARGNELGEESRARLADDQSGEDAGDEPDTVEQVLR